MNNQSVAFDRAADFYDQTRGFPPGVEAGAGTLLAHTAGVNADSRVIEIGIGTGRVALPTAPHVAAYYGIDLARPMLARLVSKRTSEPIYVVEGDATRLPYPDNSFDAAFAVHIFHLIPAWRDVLREIARVLKSGAPLVHGWNDRVQPTPITDAWNSATEQYEFRGTVQFGQRETFLIDEGWREMGDRQHIVFNYTKTPRQYIEEYRQRCWSRTWAMTDEQIDAGIKAVEAIIPQHYTSMDEPISLDAAFVAQAYLPPEA